MRTSIKDITDKIKSWASTLPEVFDEPFRERLFMVLLVVLASLASFGTGMLTGRESLSKSGKSGIVIGHFDLLPGETSQKTASSSPTAAQTSVQTSPDSPKHAPAHIVFASKNGTKYYFPSCTNRVSEANRVWYASEAEAKAFGLTLASKCHK